MHFQKGLKVPTKMCVKVDSWIACPRKHGRKRECKHACEGVSKSVRRSAHGGAWPGARTNMSYYSMEIGDKRKKGGVLVFFSSPPKHLVVRQCTKGFPSPITPKMRCALKRCRIQGSSKWSAMYSLCNRRGICTSHLAIGLEPSHLVCAYTPCRSSLSTSSLPGTSTCDQTHNTCTSRSSMSLAMATLGTCMKSSIVHNSYFINERFIYEP